MKKSELTAEQRQEVREWVALLISDAAGENKRTLTSVATEIMGFGSVAPLSMLLADPKKGTSLERYKRLKAVVENNGVIPDELPALTGTKEKPDTTKFQKLVDHLISAEINSDEIARAVGFRHAQSMRKAIWSGKVTAENYQALVRFSESTLARKRDMQVAAEVTAPLNRGHTAPPVHSALDAFTVSAQYVELARTTLRKGVDSGVFKSLMVPGVEGVIRRLDDVEEVLESAVA